MGLERPFLDLVLQTPRPRGRGRPLYADLSGAKKEKKTAQRESFRAGCAADVHGSFVRTSWVKNFGQALETMEKQAFGRGHP